MAEYDRYRCHLSTPHAAHKYTQYDLDGDNPKNLSCIGIAGPSEIYEEDMYSSGSEEMCSDVHIQIDCVDLQTKIELLKVLTKSGLKFNYSSYPAGYFDERETDE